MGQTKVVEKRFVATRMDQKPSKKLEWLWPERIAMGTLTVLAGGFGSGKSLLAADLAARVSRGDAWPDGRPGLGPSAVLMFSHEDDCGLRDALEAAGADMTRIVSLEETEELGSCGRETKDHRRKDVEKGADEQGPGNVDGLGSDAGEENAENAEDAETEGHGDAVRDEGVDGIDGLARFAPRPRPLSPEYRGEGSQDVDAEGADELEVVKRRPINLKVDLDVLDEYLAGMDNCRLVIIDPIDAHLTGGNTVAARMWLRSLMLIAAKYRVAMVLVTGLKDGRKSPLYRLMGGIGLAGAARGVWAVVPEVRDQRSEVGKQESEGRGQRSEVGCQRSEEQRRILLGVKNNLSGERTGLAFRLVVDEERGVPRVEWSSEVVTETVAELMEVQRHKSAKPSYAVSRAMEFLQEALAAGPKLMREVELEAKEREGISRSSLERARKEMKVRAFRKVVPGAWWICLKEDEAGKMEPARAIEGVEVVDGVGNVAEENAENAEDAETMGGGDAARGEGLEGLEDVEDVDGLEDVEGIEVVESVEGLEGVAEDAGDGEVFDEETLAAMEAFVRAPSRFGELAEEQQALLRALMMNEDRFVKFWSVVRERLEVVEGVEGLGFDKLIPGENGAEGAAKRIALRSERRRKLAQKMRRIKKERQKQRKMQRRR